MSTKFSDYYTGNLIPFDEPLSREFLMKKAEAELNETEGSRERGLEQLRTLITEHSVRCITTDEFLLRFLRTKKFDVQRSFAALQNYSKERVRSHHLISNLREETMEACLQNTLFGTLPYRDYEGRLIVFMRVGKWKESICTFEEAVMCSFVFFCNALEDESAQITGVHALAEESCFSLKKSLLAVRHLYSRKDFVLKSSPVRYARADVMNEPVAFKAVFEFLKLVMPEKLINRFSFHGKDTEELFRHIPQCLVHFDSEETMTESFVNHKLIGIMKSYLEKFKQEQQYFFDEQSDQ